MLPSVSEVLKELTARAPVEPDVAFRAAREVCAEELKRIRDAGGDSVPLEELVRRAHLRATGTPLAAPPAPPAPPAPEPPEIFEAAAEPPYVPAEVSVEEPFGETTGAMDLRWDRDGREPFTGPNADEPHPPEAYLRDAPAASGEEAPPRAGPTPPDVPIPFALPAEEDALYPPASSESRTEILAAEAEPAEGPGDETLTRLSREAEAIDLHSVFPVPGAVRSEPPEAVGIGTWGEPGRPEAEAAWEPESVPPPFEDDEDTVLTIPRGGRRGGGERGPRVGLLLGIGAGLAALAGLGYLLVGLWVERDATPPPVAAARPTPGPTRAVPAGGPAGPEATAPEVAASATPGSALPEVAEKEPDAAPPPTPVTIVAAPRVLPTPAAPPQPSPVTLAPAPRPSPVAVARSRDGLVVTLDRAGEPQIFSIHFTSYRDRASAERDLKRIEGLAGREGYVAEVELGEKGTWYRVMVGEFPTAQEAKAVREELAAKGTRDMGWVYRVVGPEGAERR